MSRAFGFLSLLVLSACVQPHLEAEGGIIETTDEMSLVQTGFPAAAVTMTRSVTLDDGTTLMAVQYATALATQAMIDAAPAALCGAFGLTLVSSRSLAPSADYLETPGDRVIEAICK